MSDQAVPDPDTERLSVPEAAAPAPPEMTPVGPSRSLVPAIVQFPRRAVLLLLTLLLSTAVIFLLFLVLPPGDPAAMLLGERATPQQMQELRAELGLDDPLAVQYTRWLSRAMSGDLGVSITMGSEPVSALVSSWGAASLLLMGVSFVLALILAAAGALVGSWLQRAQGVFAAVLRWLTRLLVDPLAAAPAFVLGIVLMFIFAIKFRDWGLPALPVAGALPPGGRGVLDRIPHLILPAVALAVLPALLAARSVARSAGLQFEHGGVRRWLAGACLLLGALFGQIGGMLSALVLVESVFSYPGLGRAVLESAFRRDVPVLMGVLLVLALLVLIGRLAAELFRWLARLLGGDPSPTQPEPERPPRLSRGLLVALLLLIIPLLIGGSGLLVSADRVRAVDPGAALSEPSGEHPLGTDQLGRDVLARLRRGAANDLLVAIGALGSAVLALLWGALTGALGGHRAAWSESLADVLLLPFDALGLIPILPLLIGFRFAFGPAASPESSGVLLAVAVAVGLTPRAIRFYQQAWIAAPAAKRWLVRLVPGLIALALGVLYAGLLWGSALGFAGLGLQPPVPTLGAMVGEGMRGLLRAPSLVLWPALTLWACAAALFVACDVLLANALPGEALARLNE